MTPTELNSDLNWGVLISKHHEHQRVTQGLREKGIDYFIPTEADEVYIHGKRVHRERLVIGSYILFVVNECWKEIQTMIGVARVILASPDFKTLNEGKELEPAKINVKQMDAFREFVSRPPVVKSIDGFFYGQRVTPVSVTHSFAFHIGVFDGKGRKGKLAAIFKMFGRDCRVMFKPGELQAA